MFIGTHYVRAAYSNRTASVSRTQTRVSDAVSGSRLLRLFVEVDYALDILTVATLDYAFLVACFEALTTNLVVLLAATPLFCKVFLCRFSCARPDITVVNWIE